MAPAKKATSTTVEPELCRRCFPNGWAGVELVVPDANTVGCEHGQYYHPDRYTPPADDAEAGEVEAPTEE